MRNLIFDGGFEQGFEQGHAEGALLTQARLDLALEQGRNFALRGRYSREDGDAFEEGFAKGKGKGREKGFDDGWSSLTGLRVPQGVHAYLVQLVDADERRMRAMGDLAERSSAHAIWGARIHLADIEPSAQDRGE